jgi:hypothetical protein
MDADELEVYHYLKSWGHAFVSTREIARRAGGKRKFRETPDWAFPVLARMIERGIIECDHGGRYRLKLAPKNDETKPRWVSPQVAKILKESGKDFSGTFNLEADPDSNPENR